MNKFFIYLIKYLYVVGLMYLFGVWVSLDWNPLHWGWIGRIYVALIILLGLCVLGTDAGVPEPKKEERCNYDDIPW